MFRNEYMNKRDEVFCKKMCRIQKIFDQIKGNLLIFGAGRHTLRLLKIVSVDALEIRVCDNHTEGTICGWNIEKPNDELYAWADKILISSYIFQYEIFEEIRKHVSLDKIISLYKSKEDLPFYEIKKDIDLQNSEPIDEQSRKPSYKFNAWKNVALGGESYDKSVEKDFFYAVESPLIMKYVKKGKVLDVGAGTGRLSGELFKNGCEVIAADTSDVQLDYLKRKFPKIEICIVKDEHLPFDDNTFDTVTSVDMLCHFDNWQVFLKEHIRVLKPGGVCIFSCNNKDNLSSITKSNEEKVRLVKGTFGTTAAVSKQELLALCREIKNTSLEAMVPYKFFGQNGLFNGCLSMDEMENLRDYYGFCCKNVEAAKIIEQFEREIIQKLPGDTSFYNICVLRKNE